MNLRLPLLLALAACSAPIDGTVQTHTVSASDYEQDYAIQVFVPDGPGPYQVVYLFDGDNWTDRTAGIVSELARDGAVVAPLVVGIGYGEGRNRRARDYTPAAEDIPDGHGEVEAFYGFMETDLVPWVDENFDTRTDRTDRVVIGHSFGGTAALWWVFFNQSTFGNTVALSPSLAFGDGVFFEHEATYAETHDDLDVQLYLSAGGQEAHGLAGLTEAFGELLDERDYPSLSLQTTIEPGHIHSTLFPVGAEAGLAFVLETP